MFVVLTVDTVGRYTGCPQVNGQKLTGWFKEEKKKKTRTTVALNYICEMILGGFVNESLLEGR